MSGVRTSVLGGEVARRGLLSAAPRSVVSRSVGAGAVLLVVLVLISGASIAAGVVCAGLLAGVWWLVWPRAGGLEEPRLDAFLRRRRGAARRGKLGTASFMPLAAAPADYAGPLWDAPAPVGRVEPLAIGEAAAAGGLFVLHHMNPGEPLYLSVLCETGGLGTGLRADDAYAQTQVAYGRLLATFARSTRWITGLQQINRVVPHDSAQHRRWAAEQIRPPAEDAPAEVHAGFRQLVEAYEAKVAAFADHAEQHRNYLVARVDLSPAFLRQAARRGGGPDAYAELVLGELRTLQALVAATGLGRLSVLGAQRTVAAMRALQSPDYAPDRHAGLSWPEAFLPFAAAQWSPPAQRARWWSPLSWIGPRVTADHLIVDDGWCTRTCYVPADGLAPAAIGPRWLAPILTDLTGVVRTVSARIDLVPERDARAAAVMAKTSDTAAALDAAESGRTDDGTEAVLLSSSSRMLADLAPGSGAAGVRWGLFITLQAQGHDALLDACDQLEEAAGSAGINRLAWCDDDQDLAWVAALPLARGIRA